MSTVFLYNKENKYGLLQDVKLLEATIKRVTGKVRHADPLEHPVLSDLAVHFEVPYYGWMPWARRNVIVVNPEWWEAGWNSYLEHTDALIFKCPADRDNFMRALPEGCARPNDWVLPWTCLATPEVFAKQPRSADHTLLWLLGASVNKRLAASKVLPMWKEEYPPLTVYSVAPLDLSGVSLASNITLKVQDLSDATRQQIQAYHTGHLIFSAAEALGMAAHEGMAAGSYLIGNALLTYIDAFLMNQNIYLTPCKYEHLKAGRCDTFELLTSDQLDFAVTQFRNTDLVRCTAEQRVAAMRRREYFEEKAKEAFTTILANNPQWEIKTLPPNLGSAADCPPISIITLLHNRRKFVDLCFHNLMITDYPKDKIEWVVIEDSDDVNEQAGDKILKFAHTCSPMNVSYIPLDKKNVPIGAMRNRAITKAQHDIILFMDDDDHYPPTSFSRRVAWLMKHPWTSAAGGARPVEAAVCTTIACYDLIHGTSSVNTPPWSLPLKQRISEATLTFKKSWWEKNKFPKVNMAEGEGFLEGREHEVLELQPQQIIVAMTHGKNASSRRAPPTGQPSCFWGFPKEFLIFLHGLAGVKIEEDTSKPKPKTNGKLRV
jgi:hypothetical protein